ncbi:hypothetical protein [Endozoicomonas sp. ALC020]|uniref:hypothetical protein n=1 Tax=unclassified Endozoicomonas TaxID=2644528 RepID=UPI003BAE87A6
MFLRNEGESTLGQVMKMASIFHASPNDNQCKNQGLRSKPMVIEEFKIVTPASSQPNNHNNLLQDEEHNKA